MCMQRFADKQGPIKGFDRLGKALLDHIGSVHGYKESSLALPATTTFFAKNRMDQFGYWLSVAKDSNMEKNSNMGISEECFHLCYIYWVYCHGVFNIDFS